MKYARTGGWALALAALSLGLGHAQETAGGGGVPETLSSSNQLAAGHTQNTIVAPTWLKTPDGFDAKQFYPADAVRRAVSGEAKLQCTVSDTGLLIDCQIIGESPTGYGFGAAALAVSSRFVVNPNARNKPKDGARIEIPISFKCVGFACDAAAVDRPESTRGNGGADRNTVDSLLPQSNSSRLFVNVVWQAAPNLEQWSQSYPPEAKSRRAAGSARVRCRMSGDGALRACKVVSETPENAGFGKAALSLSRYFTAPQESGGEKTRNGYVEYSVAYPADLAAGGSPRLTATQIWKAPQAGQINGAFPSAARSSGVASGSAAIRCTRHDDGSVGECSVISESPAQAGFGQAAISMAPYFRLTVWGQDGRPTTTSVAIPFAFSNVPSGG